jgi:hypothetical protein
MGEPTARRFLLFLLLLQSTLVAAARRKDVCWASDNRIATTQINDFFNEICSMQLEQKRNLVPVHAVESVQSSVESKMDNKHKQGISHLNII